MSLSAVLRFCGRFFGLSRRKSIRTEVGAHLPVITVLCRQLEQTAEEMEGGVVAVSASFAGMAGEARDVVARASRLLGTTEADQSAPEPSVGILVESSRSTIRSLMQRMERLSTLSLRTVDRMQQVEAGMQRIVAFVAEVDRIAFCNKLLALNARIEAARVGEAGSGFGIVADEISGQAYRSTEIAEEIQDVMKELSATVLSAAGELRAMASEDRRELEESQREVHEALDALSRAHERMTGVLAETTTKSERVADEISRAVVNLQFQDRLSQRIEHVIDSLNSMRVAFVNSLGESGEEQELTSRHHEVIASLHRTYTMEAERAAHGGSHSGTESAEEHSGSSVEIF